MRSFAFALAACALCASLACASRARADEVSTPNVSVFERDGKRVIVVVIGPDAAPSPPRVAPPAARASVWPWLLVAGGGIATTAAGIFQAVAIGQEAQSTNYLLHSGRADLTRAESADILSAASSHHDAARRDQTAAISLAIVGLAAIAAGVTWAIVRDRPVTTATLTPAGPGLAGATF